MSSLERRYLDPWDIENYIYLRKGPARRRSVCFDKAVQYASYPAEDGFGPIYGSLVEAGLKPGTEYPEDEKSIYSLPPPSHCPSCHRGFEDYHNMEDSLYEDLKSGILEPRRLAMERERGTEKSYRASVERELRRRKENKFGMNTLGHLRIDYSGNWNKLDRYIGHV